MSAENKKIRLPFWETVRRSYMYVIANFGTLCKLAAPAFAIVIYEMCSGFPTIDITNGGNYDEESLSNIVAVVLYLLVSLALSVACCRQIIIKKHGEYMTWEFWRRTFFYILCNLLILLIIAVCVFVTFCVASVVFAMFGAANHRIYVFMAFAFIVFVILGSRFFIALPAAAVGNKEAGIMAAFRMAKGNANRIFWGHALMVIPGIVLMYAWQFIYAIIGSGNFVSSTIVMVIYFAVSFLDTIFRASYFAHAYQYFIYYQKKDK